MAWRTSIARPNETISWVEVGSPSHLFFIIVFVVLIVLIIVLVILVLIIVTSYGENVFVITTLGRRAIACPGLLLLMNMLHYGSQLKGSFGGFGFLLACRTVIMPR